MLGVAQVDTEGKQKFSISLPSVIKNTQNNKRKVSKLATSQPTFTVLGKIQVFLLKVHKSS